MTYAEVTTYVDAVKAILQSEAFDLSPYITGACPECEQCPTPDDGEHIMDATGSFVLVGCEGYWVVNPNVVGISAPNWQGSNMAAQLRWGAGTEHYLAGPCQDPDCEIHHAGEYDHEDRTCKVCYGNNEKG